MHQAYNNRGAIYAVEGLYDNAIEDYIQALRIKPDFKEAKDNLMQAYAAKAQDSGKNLNTLRAKAADKFTFHQAYLSDYAMGEFDEMISRLGEAIRQNPGDAVLYHNRGVAYTNKGEFDKAISDYDSAVSINPEYALAYFNRAVAYFAKGDIDSSWRDVRKAQSLGYKINPEFLRALREGEGPN